MNQISSQKQFIAQLEAAALPLSIVDCRSCPDPCDQGHDEYPKKFGVDAVSPLLGSVKPYRRLVVISTGKADWESHVTEVDGTLAAHLARTEKRLSTSLAMPSLPTGSASLGLLSTSGSPRIAILNGSHRTVSQDDTLQTVLVLPDYKLLVGMQPTPEGAEALWKSAVDPNVGRAGAAVEANTFKSYVLPYSCIIQICSHKSRDNRCGIAGPKLEVAFIQSLESSGWTVHTQLEDPCPLMEPPIDSVEPDQQESYIVDQLKTLPALNKALVLKNSHVGGHKFAGNCIIHLPQGSGIWYGRVTPHEVPVIVQQTIIEGLILAPLLRASVDVTRPSCKSLHDW